MTDFFLNLTRFKPEMRLRLSCRNVLASAAAVVWLELLLEIQFY